MKNFLFGIAAGLAALLAPLAISPAHAKGFIVGTYGGINWNDVEYADSWLKIDDRTGYVIGATLGTPIDAVPGLSIMGDLSFRHNGVDVLICYNALEAEDETWALMGDAQYDIPVSLGPVRPFVMAGVGYASRTGSAQAVGIELSNAGLAYQLGAGLQTNLADKVSAKIEYIYFNGPDLGYGPLHFNGDNSSVVAGLTFAFD